MSETKKPVTEDAGTKIAGYTFQFQRALYRIFSSNSSDIMVGIETGDDVVEVIKNDDGSVDIKFEQDKNSVQQTGHPFQDSSKNLWHTLHIWLSSLEKYKDKYSNIKYHLVTNKTVPEKSLVRIISNANTESEINECLKLMKDHAKTVEGEIRSTIDIVLSYPLDNLTYVIKNTELLEPSGTVGAVPLKDATISLLHLPEDLTGKSNEIYTSLFGLLIDKCQNAWLKKEPAWLEKMPFANRLHSDIQAHIMARYIERPLFSTSYKEYLQSHENSFLFLRQLQRIGLPKESCDEALNHYWGFYAERVRLRDEGEVRPSDWVQRDNALHQRWTTINSNILLNRENESDEKIAKTLFTKTIDGTFVAKLGNHETQELYFTAGNYHDLANKEGYEYFVHWHPEFTQTDKN